MIVPPIGGLGGELSALQAEGLTHGAQSAGTGTAASGEAGGFGGELTEAVSSLEKTQDSASGAAQSLATGTATNPESAVVTVQDAQLAMELASQIRAKATESLQSVFNTQV